MSAPSSPAAGPTHVLCIADDAATRDRLRDVLAAALPDATVATASSATAPGLHAAGCAVLAATLAAPLGAASIGAAPLDAADDDDDAAATARRHSARLLRAGEAARDLRHALSNPLAALLAEAQMLEMQALPGEPGQAAPRMVALCRRMIALVRTLEA